MDIQVSLGTFSLQPRSYLLADTHIDPHNNRYHVDPKVICEPKGEEIQHNWFSPLAYLQRRQARRAFSMLSLLSKVVLGRGVQQQLKNNSSKITQHLQFKQGNSPYCLLSALKHIYDILNINIGIVPGVEVLLLVTTTNNLFFSFVSSQKAPRQEQCRASNPFRGPGYQYMRQSRPWPLGFSWFGVLRSHQWWVSLLLDWWC